MSNRLQNPPQQSQASSFKWAILWLLASVSSVWLPLLLLNHLPSNRRLAEIKPPQATVSAARLQGLPRLDPHRIEGFSTIPRDASTINLSETAFVHESTQHISAGFASYPSPSHTQMDSSGVSINPTKDAILLGGPMNIESLQEKEMVPAARVERARGLLASDALHAVPLHWRHHLRALLNNSAPKRTIQAEIVRLPAPHLSQPEEIPLVVQPNGLADTTVEPKTAATRQSVEHWLERQPQQPLGEIRPVLIILEPIASDAKPGRVNTQPNADDQTISQKAISESSKWLAAGLTEERNMLPKQLTIHTKEFTR